MASRLLEGLNPEQRAAVTLARESALILAGAGSGKTRVLTTRVAWLIETRQASASGILAVTFTNKAAREMLARISAMLPIDTRGMWVGTFHGLANRLLRAHYRAAGLPQTFPILDAADQLALVKRLSKSLGIDDERHPARDLCWFINSNKEAGRRAAQVEAHDAITRRMQEFYREYDAQCAREGVVDFAELLLRAHELLARDQTLREHYRARFAHILVDEFQDTNRLQFDWLRMLAGPGNAVFAVGDDDQSIYRFRGADAAHMRDFQRHFGARTVIKLEQNYRSHGNILEAANTLIRNNRTRLGKNLWTSEGGGEPIRVHDALSDAEEAQFIVEEARRLCDRGVPAGEIAVLYRSNAQSRVVEHALFSAGLPYRVYGGLRFFERQEVKHALAYLRLIANPDDDGALARVINFPARGIGARSLEQLQDAARAGGGSLWQAALRKAGGLPLAPAAANAARGVEGFVALVERLRAACAGRSLPEMVETVLGLSGLEQHYRSEREGQDRLANLAELVNAAAQFEADPMRYTGEAGADAGAGLEEAAGERSVPALLASFLAHASLEAGEHQAGAGTEALQLMTVHAAKGLEFHSVFVTGLEEGLFPHENSLSEADGVEEERRLMYVALTRARRLLYLSFAHSRMLHGQTRYGIASRFLKELPVALLERVNGRPLEPRHAARGPAGSPAERPAPARGADAGLPWRIGQTVRHARFGEGVIVGAEGRGSDARVQVNFGREGVKWLALAYAKLEAV
jgi:DNA helicase-2/ATP-dependent DNA helicase PcrA